MKKALYLSLITLAYTAQTTPLAPLVPVATSAFARGAVAATILRSPRIRWLAIGFATTPFIQELTAPDQDPENPLPVSEKIGNAAQRVVETTYNITRTAPFIAVEHIAEKIYLSVFPEEKEKKKEATITENPEDQVNTIKTTVPAPAEASQDAVK